jgi:integrase
VLIDIVGKGGRIRTVPIPGWAHAAVDRWLQAAGITEGRVFRGLKHGKLGESIATQAIYQIVERYAKQAGVTVAPHDLRRSFAKLCREAGAELDQIQFSLGHASVKTTELYIGCHQDLQNAPGDRLQLS